MNLVAPFGFFGAGNIGDESTLQGFARLVSCYPNKIRVWMASRNPSHTARVEPSFKYYRTRGRDLRRRWARYRSAAHVVVGGTPIMDVLGAWPLSELVPLISAAYDQRKPLAFIGTGTEKLQREGSRRVVSEVLAPKVAHWSVRSERDKERLIGHGVPPERVTVAADLAWLLDAAPDDFGKEHLAQLGVNVRAPLIGVNVTNERFVSDREPDLFKKVAALLDAWVEEYAARILFFANEVRENESFDTAAGRKVLTYMNHQDKAFLIPNHYWTPQQMLSLIGCCQVTLGMRYHFCLFSALQRVPFIALKRSDKVEDLCWDMNWPHGVALTDPGVKVLELFAEIHQKKSFWAGCLQQRVEVMRERALRNLVALDILGRILEK